MSTIGPYGKLEEMNGKLDSVLANTNEIKSQIAALDSKLDDQFQARVVGPLAAAERYIGIDMKNHMSVLGAPGNEKAAHNFNIFYDALNSHYLNADTASEELKDYFGPNDPASKYTAAQWYRGFGLSLRASLVKIGIRDAKATLASVYFERTGTERFRTARDAAVKDLVDTSKLVALDLRKMADKFVAASVEEANKQACLANGKYTETVWGPKAGRGGGGRSRWTLSRDYYSYRDAAASTTSKQFKTVEECNRAVAVYKGSVPGKMGGWARENLNPAIEGFEAVARNWPTPEP